mmetsp:Transcript_41516/g.93810  ORF Transcript_41516/g.93810 Transcript_41516/m.93810 type:complete len:99 (+) Transcript_41516:3-299(+)
MLLADHSRRLSDTLSALVDGSVRAEFARLNHLAFLLNASSVEEAASLLMSDLNLSSPASAVGSRLSRSEAARVLMLRVDFSKAEIAGLLPDLELDGDI